VWVLTHEDQHALPRDARAEHGVDGLQRLAMRGIRTAESSHRSSFVVVDDDTVSGAAVELLAVGAALDALAEAALDALLRRIGSALGTLAEAALFSRLALTYAASEVGIEVLLGRIGLVVDPLLEAVTLLGSGGAVWFVHTPPLPAARG
jgi:hypothetical protein